MSSACDPERTASCDQSNGSPTSAQQDSGGLVATSFPGESPLATSWAHAMKRSTTGLSVLFLRVATTTGNSPGSKSTGSTLSPLSRATESANVVMYGPCV